jgi:hypothetical protein
MEQNQAVETKSPPVNAADGPVLVRTKYNDLADHYNSVIDGLVGEFPVPFVIRHAKNSKFVDIHSGVPLKVISTAIAAVERSPELLGVKGFSAAEARDRMQLLEAFEGTADRAEAFAADLRFTIKLTRAQLASASLQIYGMAKTLGRDPENAEIAVHAANLGRDLGRKGTGRKKEEKKQPGTPPASGVPAPPDSTPTAVN